MSLFARLAAPDHKEEPVASIFLCMHPKDHGRLRYELTEDLWAAADVFVFYPLDPDAPRDKRYFTVLAQMRAFVLPITKRLVREGSEAVEKELRFAAGDTPVIRAPFTLQQFSDATGRIAGVIGIADPGFAKKSEELLK